MKSQQSNSFINSSKLENNVEVIMEIDELIFKSGKS